MIGIIGVAIVAVIVLWTFVPGLSRFIGIVLIIDGVGGMAIRNSITETPRFPIEAAVGVGLWLMGHWLFAAKYRQWRTMMGYRVWLLPVLSWFSPIRQPKNLEYQR